MKLYKSFLMGAFSLLTAAAMSSCSEEATLDGANVVFIELTPTPISMTVGDTIPVSVTVSNESGKTIDTPVKWSVDDASVAELVLIKKGLVKGKVVSTLVDHLSRAGEDGEGETTDPTEGEDGEGEGDDPVVEPEPAPVPVDTLWTSTYALIGQRGAQGKSTLLRATLENGQYAVTNVSVVAREINNAVKALTTFQRSYQRNAGDTVWFSVTPFKLVDEAELSFDMRVTKTYRNAEWGEEDEKFTIEHPEDPASAIYIDRENERVGIIYTGPRMAALGEIELTVSDGTSKSSAVAPVHVYTQTWPSFELQNGYRPKYGPENPSNIKHLLINSNMNVKSTYDLGVCVGIDMGHQQDIDNVYAMEQAGLIRWEVESGPVLIEDYFIDWDYFSGYVSYVRIKSGASEGVAVVKYIMPDTTLTCNITIENYDITYPVDRIVVREGQEEIDYTNGVQFPMNQVAALEISVEPEPSYEKHIPVVTSSDPSVISVDEKPANSGYSQTFTLHKPGSAVITVTALDKTISFPATAYDVVQRVQLDVTNPLDLMVGNQDVEIGCSVLTAAGLPLDEPVNWIVSDPSVLSVTPKPGQYDRAYVTPLAAGTTTIIAEYKGVRSTPQTYTVSAISDYYAADYVDEGLFMGDWDGESFYITVGTNIMAYGMLWNTPYVLPGTYTGNCAIINVGSTEFTNCAYSFTVTDAGDPMYSLEGWIDLGNGSKIILDGSQFFYM